MSARGRERVTAGGRAAERPGREARLVALLCLLAALRVFLFAAGFPLFNNTDEQAHFDLVLKYARGHVPAALEHHGVEASRDITLYGTMEYLVPAWRFPGGAYPVPMWRVTNEAIRPIFAAGVERFTSAPNPQSTQPPLYYAVAALWYRLGRLAGLEGGWAAYWIRFLDVLAVALLVALAWRFARTLFPGDGFLALGLPLLVAFLPQDTLYSINNDVLVPLVGGAALLGLFVIARGDERGLAWHAGTGLLVAAGVLVKTSCLPVLAVAPVAVALAVRRAGAARRRTPLARGLVLLLAAGLPLLAWGARNLRLFGDWTGSAPKIAYLGWTPKAASALLDHPLFTPGGLVTFWDATLASLWRGEFVWGMQPLATAGWDRFYAVSSLVLPLAVVVALILRARSLAGAERGTLWLGALVSLLAVAYLAALSVLYDFGPCFYPSRAYPFLSSGRLALAALLPFAALYLKGFEVVLPWPGMARLRWGLLVALVALMTVAELRLSAGPLRSAYNWFHLWR